MPLADDSVLKTRVPATLLRSIRMHAALDAKTLNDFVREAVEERLNRDGGAGRGLDPSRHPSRS
jgi:hypothetical protein